jgi:DNA mismatch endonuclease, patch repair protein
VSQQRRPKKKRELANTPDAGRRRHVSRTMKRIVEPPSEDVRRRMRNTPQRDTPPELKLRSCLHRLGLRFRINRRAEPDISSIVDVVFPTARVAVFVDGCFWHGCPIHGTWPKKNASFWRRKILSNVRRDLRITDLLRSKGWSVLRIWEHCEPNLAAKKVLRAVIRRRQSQQKLTR